MLGQTQNQASGTLIRARLRMGDVGRRTASQPSGTVVQQNPGPGAMVKPGSAVDLWLAEPSEVNRVKVPDVRGKNQDQAANSLARVGLELGRVAQKIDNRPAGTVIQQDPAPGSRVLPRTPVNLWLAEPREVKPPPTKVRVPHLITDTQPQSKPRPGRRWAASGKDSPDNLKPDPRYRGQAKPGARDCGLSW